MIVVCRNAKSALISHLKSGFSKIKLQNLILHNTHCNGYGQIFKENLSQYQRFCVETTLFRLTITIIIDTTKQRMCQNEQDRV